MRFQSKTKIVFAPDSIAIADIVLNLFIFFFVTFSFFATFKRQHAESSVELRLPTAGKSAIAPQQGPVIIAITQDGSVFLQDKPIDVKSLTDAVRNAIAENEQKGVVVRADKLLPLERFIVVIEAIKAADVEAIAIRTEVVAKP